MVAPLRRGLNFRCDAQSAGDGGVGECDSEGMARAVWPGMAAGVPLWSACRVNRMAYGRAARVTASAPHGRGLRLR